MLIDEQFLNMVSAQAKESPRLRMNYNFHQSLEDKCHNRNQGDRNFHTLTIHQYTQYIPSEIVV